MLDLRVRRANGLATADTTGPASLPSISSRLVKCSGSTCSHGDSAASVEDFVIVNYSKPVLSFPSPSPTALVNPASLPPSSPPLVPHLRLGCVVVLAGQIQPQQVRRSLRGLDRLQGRPHNRRGRGTTPRLDPKPPNSIPASILCLSAFGLGYPDRVPFPLVALPEARPVPGLPGTLKSGRGHTDMATAQSEGLLHSLRFFPSQPILLDIFDLRREGLPDSIRRCMTPFPPHSTNSAVLTSPSRPPARGPTTSIRAAAVPFVAALADEEGEDPSTRVRRRKRGSRGG